MPADKNRLLIVGDESGEISALLNSQGYQVKVFSSGQKALEALQGNGFEVLLVDLAWPGTDGDELLRRALEVDPDLIGILLVPPEITPAVLESMEGETCEFLPEPFPPHALLRTLSHALERRRLRRENEDLRRTLSAYELAHSLNDTLDGEVVQGRLIRTAMQLCQADEASLMLPLPNGKELVIAAVESLERSNLLGKHIYLDQGVAGWVARAGEPVILQGADKDQHFITQRRRPEVHASISLPLLAGGKLVAVLSLNAKHRRPPFREAEIKNLGILASAGAVALENASRWQTLRQSEERYRSIFEGAIGGIYRSTPQGRFLAVNRSLVRLLGYDSAEDLIESITDIRRQVFTDPKRRQELLALLEQQDEVPGFESEVRRKDGTTLWVSENIRAIHESGALVSFQGTMVDISERRRALESLRRSEEKLQALFETMNQGVLYLDENGRITSANPAAERILGLPLDQILGRSAFDPRWQTVSENGSAIPDERHPMRVALRTGEEVQGVVIGLTDPQEKEIRWLKVHAIPLFGPGDGAPIQVCTIFEEVGRPG